MRFRTKKIINSHHNLCKTTYIFTNFQLNALKKRWEAQTKWNILFDVKNVRIYFLHRYAFFFSTFCLIYYSLSEFLYIWYRTEVVYEAFYMSPEMWIQVGQVWASRWPRNRSSSTTIVRHSDCAGTTYCVFSPEVYHLATQIFLKYLS